ncbi:hypothetical protein [Streptomyces lunaelactis]|nr:hypothetical protein [Streptomyces lunaelactis]
MREIQHDDLRPVRAEALCTGESDAGAATRDHNQLPLAGLLRRVVRPTP